MYQGETLSVRRLDGDLAELVFDNRGHSVNLFDRRTVAELASALDALEGAEGLRGLLVTSAKPVFVVGADVTEFAAAFAGDRAAVRRHLEPNNRNFARLEALPFPVVAAINGYALGGGFEFCLACDYRVLSTSARVGFPEVGLGLIPGWGGTVRAPRVGRFEAALTWIAYGEQQGADAALKSGLVDAVAGPAALREEAMKWLTRAAGGELDWRARRDAKRGPAAVEEAERKAVCARHREQVAARFGDHYPAHRVAVDLLERAAPLPFAEALEAEFDAFVGLAQSPEGRALIGNFTNEQYVMGKARRIAKTASRKAERTAVLGAGIMGGGIAFQNALSGLPVVLVDIAPEALDAGIGEARRLLARRVARGRMTQKEADAVLQRIKPTLDHGPLAEVDLVVEAVVENEAVKRQVLALVEGEVRQDALLASNTSSISISRLAESLARPANFCGIHFFNPVPAMPLVEVVRGEQSSADTIARAVAYALAIGKKPVVVGDCAGFLVNRTLFMYFGGFHLLLHEGADYEAVDRAMEAWGWPMGPAWLLDVVGLDTAVHAGEVVAEAFPDRLAFDFPTATRRLVEAGRLGQKNRLGYYAYEEGEGGRLERRPDPEVARLFGPRRSFAADEIVARLMLPMAIEMARCLEEGVVESPQEADLALLLGLGFPRFRGGICRWMDELGLARVCELADRYAHLGPLYHPTERMRAMAASGATFY